MPPKKHQRSGIRSKKGESGGKNVQYITRSRALTKLQITLKDFRRLCILKGIFPRNPPKATKGKDKTYFHMKDILYLHHEPLLQKFRDLKVFLRKRTRFMGRHEFDLVENLDTKRPEFNIDHLVKERYPTFLDAVRDFDDPLSTLFLFKTLQSRVDKSFSPDRIQMVARLCNEWTHWVQTTQSLRKVFVSIKGYYFQADVKGNPITWLVPHSIMQNIPANVDFKIMMTFLQFYETFARFMNFKLYKDEKIAYPPVFGDDDESIRAKSIFSATSAEKELKKASKKTAKLAKQGKVVSLSVSAGTIARDAQTADHDNSDEEDEKYDVEKFHTIDSASLPLLNEDEVKLTKLFSNSVVLVSREVPFGPIAFVIRSAGGKAVHESDVTAQQAQSPIFTHQIVDRPKLSNFVASRQYAQPQWVFDSFNERFLLPCAPYAPGQALPPHLSPFVDDSKEGYVPDQRNQLRQWAGLKPLMVTESTTAISEEEQKIIDEETEDAQYNKDLKQEFKRLKRAAIEEAEEINAIDSDFEKDDNESGDDEDVEIIGDSDDDEEVSEADSSDEEEEAAPVKVARPNARNERDNERELAKMVMKKKDAQLLSRMEFGIERRKHKGAILSAKRKAIETGTQVVLPKSKISKLN